MNEHEQFLVINNLTKTFEQKGREEEITVIDDVSMVIKEGEFIIFLGPSGCGKTTLMRIVGGLETATQGSVILEGEEVTGPDRKKGMVFQSYSSFPWLTVLDNIRYGLKYRTDVNKKEKDDIAHHYLDLVGLKGFEDFYINRISGGMQQRVALARTFAAGSDVLLMDEPFGALDAQNREFLQEQLLEMRRAEMKTIIFVTHDVEEAVFLADRIFVFSARPATIIKVVNVNDYLPGDRILEAKENPEFFRLRNRIMALTREQAKRTEEIMVADE
ncbi:MAG: ABC transporter ATP-binding protein [bacterium]|nr:ABC transporter ATP-binding protein [bacterium]